LNLKDIFSILSPFKESASTKHVEITESGYSMMSYDPDMAHTATQMGSQYNRRLTQATRDLPEITADRAREIAYWLWETNPVAKRILELNKDFIVGEGITVHAADPEEEDRKKVQYMIDRFWNDAINQMDMKVHNKVLELSLYGEQCYPAFVNDKNGHVRLGYIDPSMIGDVVTDPDNAEIRVAVIMKPKTPGEKPDVYKIINQCEDVNSEHYGRMVGIEDGEKFGELKYKGQCFYFKVNSVSNATRGRSDLLSIADWVDAYDQILFNEVDRAILMKSFIWDVKLTGMSDTEITAYAKGNPQPKPGAVRYHNDRVEWNAVAPSMHSQDAKTGMDGILSYVATGAGLPKTWLNGMMDVNRATATELSEPAIKRLATRQQFFLYMLRQIMTFVLDQAEIAGVLKRPVPVKVSGDGKKNLNDAGKPRGKLKEAEVDSRLKLLPDPWSLSINAPELRIKNIAEASAAIQKVIAPLKLAYEMDAIDIVVIQEVVVSLVGQLGVDINIQQMRDRLKMLEAESKLPSQMAQVQKQQEFELQQKKIEGVMAGKAEQQPGQKPALPANKPPAKA
jgi:hypothetical protein